MSRSNPKAPRKSATKHSPLSSPHDANEGNSSSNFKPQGILREPTYRKDPISRDDDLGRLTAARIGSSRGPAYPYNPSYKDDDFDRPRQLLGGSYHGHNSLYDLNNGVTDLYNHHQRPTGTDHHQARAYGRNLPYKGAIDSSRDLIPGGKVYDEMLKDAARWDSPRGARNVPEYLDDWEKKWRAMGGEPNGKGQGNPKV